MAEILEKLAVFAAATNNEIFDAEYNGGEWMTRHVETHETLEQFEESSRYWNERSNVQRGEIAGFKFLSWANAQAAKGQPRDSISVVDFGDVRIALPGTDLSVFC